MSILRQLSKATADQERMESALRTKAFSSPVGRKVEKFIEKYDQYGCGFQARVAVIGCLLKTAVKRGFLSENVNLVPPIYDLTPEGKNRLERRDQFACALLGERAIRDSAEAAAEDLQRSLHRPGSFDDHI